MDITSWLPALSTSTLVVVLAYHWRELISTRLTKSVQHEFDRKIEALKADIRSGEERLKAELREKEAEISALRSGALSAISSRQAVLDKRRLEAAEQLWSALVEIGPARSLAANMSVINFEVAAEEAEKDLKVREFFQELAPGFDINKMDLKDADKVRPFVSPMVWAIFSAMRAIVWHGVMRWNVLRLGLGKKDYMSHENIEKLITSVLPSHSEYIKKHGPSVYYNLMEALEQKLLSEIQLMFNGVDSDRVGIEQAAEINRRVKAVYAATQENTSKANDISR